LTEGPWSYSVTPPARRDIKRLDPPIQRRVLNALDRFAADPGVTEIRKLADSDEWRLRVGDWRVRFSFDDDARMIVVARVLPRGRAYER
jgi:mRNA interferase RelE/StbE